jgi:ABC-type xylose transport system permease subunit
MISASDALRTISSTVSPSIDANIVSITGLCEAAIAAAVTSARLNAASSGLGTGVELQVIAAAVIGGTSFAGGIGTIPGGVQGAVTMQSLSSGMVLIGVNTAWLDIVVGLVLVSAVGIDTFVRRYRALTNGGVRPPCSAGRG